MTRSNDRAPKVRMQHHREILAAAKEATPEQRREILEAVRRDARVQRRARPVPRWLARRANRRALALIAAAPFACGVTSAFMTPEALATSLVQLAGAVGLLAGLLLLRRVTKELTEIPDADLDERELGERNEALRIAYLALVGCLVLVGLIAITDGPVLDMADWKPLFFGTFGTAVLLPSAAAAWKWRDLDDEA
ncbi:hypothetical protein [Actinomadura alba]|uniref:DUF3040 domain-containing protein n=1 Tax=Actinomadura alba TaxID=406431 RepID=A0ABR7LZN6_9ACTN|nr:hypothetical protein [Actinomadura alba]MBC6470241.1 hypothetical protein [Actinomadura alba]